MSVSGPDRKGWHLTSLGANFGSGSGFYKGQLSSLGPTKYMLGLKFGSKSASIKHAKRIKCGKWVQVQPSTCLVWSLGPNREALNMRNQLNVANRFNASTVSIGKKNQIQFTVPAQWFMHNDSCCNYLSYTIVFFF